MREARISVLTSHQGTMFKVLIETCCPGSHTMTLAVVITNNSCDEGHRTRLLSKRGARMTAIDIAEVFLAHAQQAETPEPLGIEFRLVA
jgi:hypothetical protein